MKSDTDLIKAAARVARNAPESWETFLVALSAYSITATTQCIQSPLEELQRTQGRAQATARLYGLLVDCIKRADEIESRQK